jgi:hypothetical protein
MIELDKLFYDALQADNTLTAYIGGTDRITSTCFEVSPDEADNTPLPCIIVTDDGLTNNQQSKDNVWESDEDRVQASVEVDGTSPKQVKQLIRMVRKAINNYITTLYTQGEDIPNLQSVQTNGVAWDWMKPCYHSTISYQCDVDNGLYDDEQESNSDI